MLTRRIVDQMGSGVIDGAAGALETALVSPESKLTDTATQDVEILRKILRKYVHLGGGGDPDLWPHVTTVEDTKEHESRSRWLTHRRNVALIDETTFFMARGLIDGTYPLSPLGLLDLSTYVTNFVLRDYVVRNVRTGTSPAGYVPPPHLPEDDVVLKDSLGSNSAMLSTALWVNKLRKNSASERALRQDVTKSWRALLGKATPAAVHQFTDTASLWHLTVNEVANALYLHHPSDPHDRNREVAEAVAFCNFRGLFNLEFARDLGIPYAGSITRLPARRHLWEQGRLGDAVLTAATGPDLRLIHVLDTAYRERAQKALTQREEVVVLPVLLAAVVGKIDRLDQFHDRLLEVREKAQPLRKRLAEIESALNRAGSLETERALFAAFGDDARVFRRLMGEGTRPGMAAIGAVLSAATGQSAWVTASIALIEAADQLRRDPARPLINRLARRHLWFVTEIGAVCDGMNDISRELGRLWSPVQGTRFDDEFMRRLNRARSLQFA